MSLHTRISAFCKSEAEWSVCSGVEWSWSWSGRADVSDFLLLVSESGIMRKMLGGYGNFVGTE